MKGLVEGFHRNQGIVYSGKMSSRITQPQLNLAACVTINSIKPSDFRKRFTTLPPLDPRHPGPIGETGAGGQENKLLSVKIFFIISSSCFCFSPSTSFPAAWVWSWCIPPKFQSRGRVVPSHSSSIRRSRHCIGFSRRHIRPARSAGLSGRPSTGR